GQATDLEPGSVREVESGRGKKRPPSPVRPEPNHDSQETITQHSLPLWQRPEVQALLLQQRFRLGRGGAGAAGPRNPAVGRDPRTAEGAAAAVSAASGP